MGLVACVLGHGVFASLFLGSLPAQEAFAPPRAHPVERYQEGWRRNPFALKTAPVAPEEVSFARDLAMAGCFGAENNPSVIIVNTRTHERTRLKKGDRAPSGMMLKSVTFASSRKETMAEVTLGGETAVLRFDESYIKQFAARKRSLAATGQRAGGPAGSLASGSLEPVASTPTDQGSGYPPTHGRSGDAGAGSAAVAESSLAQGRRRLLTAQKPVGLGK